jgi:aminobenzoyl-glutamate utilization protein B
VIGTPAEEGKCGKSYMIAAGVFDDVDVAMMAHPSQFTAMIVTGPCGLV